MYRYKKKDVVRTSKDIGYNPHDVESCKVYNKKCETTSIPETLTINQDERKRLNEVREKSENKPDIKRDLIEYIKDFSKRQQQIISNDNRKTKKLLDVPIKSKKDTVTESRLVTLEMKECS